jgi:arginase
VAVKIVREPKKIALLGVPTSAAGLALGHERAPAALRTAGLVERLREAGYEVNDLGDDPAQLYQPDEESPRARNLPRVLKALEALKPRVEMAVKSCALPLILGGDCSIALATVAGLHRYFRNVSILYMDRDADLNVPATTPSGCLDGMVVSHLAGRGAAELVRFWSEPPLVREPDIALFGVDRLDPPEEGVLQHSPIRRYLAADVKRMGAAAAAEAAVVGMHGGSQALSHEFVLHFDVDVISSEDFSATNLPASGGLSLDEVRQALEVFVRQKHLAAIEVTAFNPERDPDGSAARKLVDLIVTVLATRLAAFAAPAEVAAAAETSAPAPAPEVHVAVAEAAATATVPASPAAEFAPAESEGTSPDATEPAPEESLQEAPEESQPKEN